MLDGPESTTLPPVGQCRGAAIALATARPMAWARLERVGTGYEARVGRHWLAGFRLRCSFQKPYMVLWPCEADAINDGKIAFPVRIPIDRTANWCILVIAVANVFERGLQ